MTNLQEYEIWKSNIITKPKQKANQPNMCKPNRQKQHMTDVQVTTNQPKTQWEVNFGGGFCLKRTVAQFRSDFVVPNRGGLSIDHHYFMSPPGSTKHVPRNRLWCHWTGGAAAWLTIDKLWLGTKQGWGVSLQHIDLQFVRGFVVLNRGNLVDKVSED